MTPLILLTPLIVCLLNGCASPQVPTQRVVEVKVALPVPCVTKAPVVPLLASDADLVKLADNCRAEADATCGAYVNRVFADRERLLAYKLEADAAIAGCVVR